MVFRLNYPTLLSRSAKQGRVRYVPEYNALSIESVEELFSVSLSVNIKDWLRKKGEQVGKSMQDIVAGDPRRII